MNIFNKLSIVVPVGPDDTTWHNLLGELARLGTEPEIILSACRAQSDNFDLPVNAQWLDSKQGRASQLNAGAQACTGQFIWFLHSDTCMSNDVITAVKDFMESDQSCLGYFKLKFANDGPRLTLLNAWAANLRSRVFNLPFGDQGFIIKHKIFNRMNGYDEALDLGEDLDFVVRSKSAGIDLKQLPAELITSARRYRDSGWCSTSLLHIWLTWQLTYQSRQRLKFSG